MVADLWRRMVNGWSRGESMADRFWLYDVEREAGLDAEEYLGGDLRIINKSGESSRGDEGSAI